MCDCDVFELIGYVEADGVRCIVVSAIFSQPYHLHRLKLSSFDLTFTILMFSSTILASPLTVTFLFTFLTSTEQRASPSHKDAVSKIVPCKA